MMKQPGCYVLAVSFYLVDMSVFEPVFAVYFLLYSLYSMYRLSCLLDYIKSFYVKGMLSEQDYARLHDKYTGFFKYYAMLPDRAQYAALYEDAEFSRFSMRMRYVRNFFWVTGIGFTLFAIFT
jgi:hypothetical protein